eukprot:5403389-Pleurochrysis_carterae.AAC.1
MPSPKSAAVASQRAAWLLKTGTTRQARTHAFSKAPRASRSSSSAVRLRRAFQQSRKVKPPPFACFGLARRPKPAGLTSAYTKAFVGAAAHAKPHLRLDGDVGRLHVLAH